MGNCLGRKILESPFEIANRISLFHPSYASVCYFVAEGLSLNPLFLTPQSFKYHTVVRPPYYIGFPPEITTAFYDIFLFTLG